MKRNQKIIGGLLSTAITFGILYAFAGERYMAKERQGNACSHYCKKHTEGNHWYENSERPAVENPGPGN